MLTAKFPWQIKPIAKIRSTVAFVPDLYFLQQSQSQEPPRSFALFIVFSHKFWSANLNRISILQLTFLWREAKSDPAKYLYFICTSFFILSRHKAAAFFGQGCMVLLWRRQWWTNEATRSAEFFSCMWNGNIRGKVVFLLKWWGHLDRPPWLFFAAA